MQRFRIGAITDEFSQDIGVAAAAMRELGMKGAELRMIGGRNIMDLSDDEISRALDTLHQNGLQVVAIASPILKCAMPKAPALDARFEHLRFASDHTWDDQPQLAERAFEIARRTGAKIVRVFSCWRVVRPAEVFERVVDSLQDLADKAEKHGLIIGLENEPSCNIATAQETASILAAIDHTNLQLVWDPANAYIAGENPFPSGYKMLNTDRVAHVHAKDCTLEDHKPVWEPLGQGDLDWQGQIDALAEDGYKGFIHLDTHWQGPGGDRLEGSRICAKNLKALVESLAL